MDTRFIDADVAAFIADVYPASEAPIPGVSGQTIVDEMIREGHAAAQLPAGPKTRSRIDIGRMLEPGDCVISASARATFTRPAAILAARREATLDELQNCHRRGRR